VPDMMIVLKCFFLEYFVSMMNFRGEILKDANVKEDILDFEKEEKAKF
jgi:hypothetical protein